MNSLIKLFSILVVVILSSCSTNNNVKRELNLTINNFMMNRFSDDGEKLFTIISPKSNLDKISNIYELENIEIIFYEDDKNKYLVKADSAILEKQIVTLNGNVVIKDIVNNESEINSDELSWDIEKSIFTLEGNVVLEDNYINLISSKAILNQDSNIIKFFNPVKYSYKQVNNQSEYNISSENAFYDMDNQTIIFSSEGERVKSTIYFN